MLRSTLPAEQGRIRHVAVVRPYGLSTPVEVSELLPPAQQNSELTDEHLCRYESAVDAFIAGQWNEALGMLHRITAADPVKEFLVNYITQHHLQAPQNWDGVIVLESK
jgi:adenylate cyclase